MSKFREFDRDTGFLLPPSLDEWLPYTSTWARFVVEVIDGLDLGSAMGEEAHRAPASVLAYPIRSCCWGLLVYGYATRASSSRKLERATYDLAASPVLSR